MLDFVSRHQFALWLIESSTWNLSWAFQYLEEAQMGKVVLSIG